jgi:hypothetical protein
VSSASSLTLPPRTTWQVSGPASVDEENEENDADADADEGSSRYFGRHNWARVLPGTVTFT